MTTELLKRVLEAAKQHSGLTLSAYDVMNLVNHLKQLDLERLSAQRRASEDGWRREQLAADLETERQRRGDFN